MSWRCSRREWLYRLTIQALGATAVTSQTGCGSILYPERIGQQRTRGLDWRVVAMDGVGLLLFFVPGLIAFAVDFYNGTIYLPAETYTAYSPDTDTELRPVAVSPDSLDSAEIERVVSQHLGQPVTLTQGSYHTRPLASLKEFWPQAWRLRSDVPA